MLPSWIAIVAGLLLLVWGSDRFVQGASATAASLGVSPLIIGLTIVGFGTSAPEIMVGAVAASQGNTGIAIGNALGSNIANIALVLGITALIAPLTVQSGTLRREFPAMFLVMAFAGVLLYDGLLTRVDGLLLLAGLAGMLFWLLHIARSSRRADPIIAEYEHELPGRMPLPKSLFLLLAGLLVLVIGSRLLVWGAVEVATSLGVSDLVIGLTIIAVGTSLPELATSVVSARRGEPDIAIGNVIGSNMFNLLPVLGVPALIGPDRVPDEALSRDFLIMATLGVVLFLMAYGLRGPGRINRVEGGILFACFAGYQYLLLP